MLRVKNVSKKGWKSDDVMRAMKQSMLKALSNMSFYHLSYSIQHVTLSTAKRKKKNRTASEDNVDGMSWNNLGTLSRAYVAQSNLYFFLPCETEYMSMTV